MTDVWLSPSVIPDSLALELAAELRTPPVTGPLRLHDAPAAALFGHGLDHLILVDLRNIGTLAASLSLTRDFLRGVTEGGGIPYRLRGTMFVGNFARDGAVTPGPSRVCDITTSVKRRPKSAQQSRDSTVAAHRAQSVTVPSSQVTRECS